MMNKIFSIAFVLVTASLCKAQELVYNGDFEDYVTCPSDYSQIYSALFWSTPTTNSIDSSGTPDYFSECATFTGVSIPQNNFGFQDAHGGIAYCGIILWEASDTIREYIEVPLQSTLVAGRCYHFQMYVSLGNQCQYTTEALGIYFSDTAVNGVDNFNTLPFTAQLNNEPGNNFDTLNWTLVSADYTATGGENDLIIGNFKNDIATNATLMNPNALLGEVYCYIDDVSLTETNCDTASGINNPFCTSSIKISPNPNNGEFEIDFGNSSSHINEMRIEVENEMGITVLSKHESFLNGESKRNLTLPNNLPSGIYYVKSTEENATPITRMMIVQHD